jgi:hypothetical protein
MEKRGVMKRASLHGAPVCGKTLARLLQPFRVRRFSSPMRRFVFLLLLCLWPFAAGAQLPFETVFKGRHVFDRLVREAKAGNWAALPIGDRTATVGRALVGTPYKGYTLEIDDHIEAPSVNFTGLDCWTFFEIALGFARMLYNPPEQWTPQMLLRYIQLDRYRNGTCDGTYMSRLHYLEEWVQDNERRKLVRDLTRELGGIRGPHSTGEMMRGWKNYRYMVASAEVREAIARMEERIARQTLYYIPNRKVAGIEPMLRSGDVISICSKDGAGIATSHVGLALRDENGVLRFMHASAPRNYGKVLIDLRLSDYLARYTSHVGIMVARPIR